MVSSVTTLLYNAAVSQALRQALRRRDVLAVQPGEPQRLPPPYERLIGALLLHYQPPLEQLLHDVGGDTTDREDPKALHDARLIPLVAGRGGSGDPEHEMESALDTSNETRASCGYSRFERGISTNSACKRILQEPSDGRSALWRRWGIVMAPSTRTR